jgi:hypothetical protein
MQHVKDIAYATALFGMGVVCGYTNGSSRYTHVEIHTHKTLDDIPEPRAVEHTETAFRWGQWGHPKATRRVLEKDEIQKHINETR